MTPRTEIVSLRWAIFFLLLAVQFLPCRTTVSGPATEDQVYILNKDVNNVLGTIIAPENSMEEDLTTEDDLCVGTSFEFAFSPVTKKATIAFKNRVVLYYGLFIQNDLSPPFKS